MQYIIEARFNGVWSWENLNGADDISSALLDDSDLVAGDLDPDLKANLALDAGVGPSDVRVRPATPAEIAVAFGT